jgi:prepilin-type N-terminal cleavage/methylation domain-containing protein
MKFQTRIQTSKKRFAERLSAGFTLVEVMAAMVFMAIVIPVALQGVRVASLAGEVAHRKTLAVREAEFLINQTVTMRDWTQAIRRGSTKEGQLQFDWIIRSELWTLDAMRQITVEVAYTAQGNDYTVRLATLVRQ